MSNTIPNRNNFIRQPEGTTNNSVYVLISRYGNGNGLDAPTARVRAYFHPSTNGSGRITIEHADQCYHSTNARRDFASGARTSFRFYQVRDLNNNAAEIIQQIPVSGGGQGPAQYNNTFYSSNSSCVNRSFNFTNLPAIANTSTRYLGWYVMDIAVSFTTTTPGINAFKVIADRPGSLMGIGDENDYRFALQDRVSADYTRTNFTIKFALECDSSGEDVTLRWFDDDAGGIQQNTNFRMTVSEKPVGSNTVSRSWYLNYHTPGNLQPSHHNFVTTTGFRGNQSPGAAFASARFPARPGYTYEWTWHNVYKQNGIQVQPPFDAINAFLPCAEWDYRSPNNGFTANVNWGATASSAPYHAPGTNVRVSNLIRNVGDGRGSTYNQQIQRRHLVPGGSWTNWTNLPSSPWNDSGGLNPNQERTRTTANWSLPNWQHNTQVCFRARINRFTGTSPSLVTSSGWRYVGNGTTESGTVRCIRVNNPQNWNYRHSGFTTSSPSSPALGGPDDPATININSLPTALAGSSITINNTIANNGNAKGGGYGHFISLRTRTSGGTTVNVNHANNTNGWGTWSDIQTWNTTNANGLAANGGSQARSFAWTIPAATADGTVMCFRTRINNFTGTQPGNNVTSSGHRYAGNTATASGRQRCVRVVALAVNASATCANTAQGFSYSVANSGGNRHDAVLQWRNDASSAWQNAGTGYSRTNQVNGTYTFDIRPWHDFGTRQFRVRVTDRGPSGRVVYGPNADGLTVGPCAYATCSLRLDPSTTEVGVPFQLITEITVSQMGEPHGRDRSFSVSHVISPAALVVRNPSGNLSGTVTGVGPATVPIREVTVNVPASYSFNGTVTGLRAQSGNADVACAGIGDFVGFMPYIRVYGGDVYSHRQIGTWNRGTDDPVGAGAGAEFIAHANDTINGFVSNTRHINASLPASIKQLSFSNLAGSDIFGGSFNGPAPEEEDYYEIAVSGKADQDAGIDMGIEFIQLASGTYNPTESINNSQVVYFDGNIVITNNAVYDDSGWTIDNVPGLVVVARGNIYIDHTVTRLDGLYVAQRRPDGTGGRINTCTNGSSTFNQNALYDECGRKLTVYGAFIADRVHFLRTNGSLGDAVTNENLGNTDNVAEVFVYSPELFLLPALQNWQTNGEFDAMSFMPPVV